MLPKCLEAITWVDEIIVVDSNSTDKTVKIAKQSGAKVFNRDWAGYAAQKNFAISKAKSKWVLNIDADEVISEGLKYEIIDVVRKGGGNNAFDMPLKNNILRQVAYPWGIEPGQAH